LVRQESGFSYGLIGLLSGTFGPYADRAPGLIGSAQTA
jgi:hypothetical protein